MNNKLALVVNFTGAGNLSGYVKNIVGLGKQGSKSIRELNAEAKKLTREIAEYDRRISRTSGSVNALWDQQKAKMLELEAVQKRINREERLMAIEADRRALAQRGADLKSRGQDNIMGGAAMAAPIILAIKSAAEFSSGMVDIQQKAELSDRATRSMANNIMLAAAAAKQLPESMRAGVDVLAGFGMDPRQAAIMVAPIGRMATAFKVDLADGAAAAYANLNNLKVPLGQTARALDVMAAAGNAGAFEVKDMARHFPGLTAQMQALGQRGVPAVADLSAALQIARRGAGDADEAANNVKNLLSKINAPATVKAFQKNFGVDLPAALKRAYAEGKTPLEAIAELTKKATGGDMTKLGYAFEDMQAQSALRSLIQDMDDFRSMRAQIAASSGTVDRAFDGRVANDATMQWRAFLGTASRLAIVLGTTLLPVATETLGMMAGAAEHVAAWAQANPGLAAGLMKGAAALITFKIGLGVAQYALGAVLGPLSTAISVIQKLRTLGTIAAIIPRLGVAFTLLTGPIGLTIAAIAGVSYAVYRYWGPISGFFQRHWTLIRNLFLGAMVIFTPWLAATVYVASIIYRNWGRISAATMAMVRTVGGIVGPFIKPFVVIGQYLGGMVSQFFSWGAHLVGGLIKGILSMGGALAKSVINLVASVGGRFAAMLGIKSPSRVFLAYGQHITDGLALGIDGARQGPARATRRMAAGVLAAGSMSLAAGGPAMARPGGTSVPAASPAPITIHVHAAPGMDVKDLAREVRRELEAAQAQKARASYADDH